MLCLSGFELYSRWMPQTRTPRFLYLRNAFSCIPDNCHAFNMRESHARRLKDINLTHQGQFPHA